jgi:hypothetical protein
MPSVVGRAAQRKSFTQPELIKPEDELASPRILLLL